MLFPNSIPLDKGILTNVILLLVSLQFLLKINLCLFDNVICQERLQLKYFK